MICEIKSDSMEGANGFKAIEQRYVDIGFVRASPIFEQKYMWRGKEATTYSALMGRLDEREQRKIS